MSQDDLIVANQAFPATRADINSNLQALGALMSGASAPGTTYAYMWWADTTNGVLKQRDSSNASWVIRNTLSASPVISKSATYTVALADMLKTINVSASGGSNAINLPAAATAGNGFAVHIKKTDSSANTVTVTANGAETIDGSVTQVLSLQYDFITMICDGSAWYILAKSSSASKLKVYQITDTTDVTLSNAGTQANVGSTVSINFPTKGLVGLFTTNELDYTSAPSHLALGMRISSTNYWSDVSGGDYNSHGYPPSTAQAFQTIGVLLALSGSPFGVHPSWVGIEEKSIPTGAQTVQMIAAKVISGGGGTMKLKGATTTTRIYIFVWDFS